MATTVIKTTIPKLVNALERYKDLSRKAWGLILQNEAVKIGFELYRASAEKGTKRGRVWADAASRGYRMGRKSESGLPDSIRGISSAAWKRADLLLEGGKSGYFGVSIQNGNVRIGRLRFSGRKTARLLLGGRYGNRFASSSRSFGQLKNADLTDAVRTRIRREMHDRNIKILNRRAVATAVEISYRNRAGAGLYGTGGLMAMQWLPKVYRKMVTENSPRAFDGNRVYLRAVKVLTSNGKYTIGSVDVYKSKSDVVGIAINGMVPGTAGFIARNGIMEAVFSSRIADRETYIKRKIDELHAATLEKQ